MNEVKPKVEPILDGALKMFDTATKQQRDEELFRILAKAAQLYQRALKLQAEAVNLLTSNNIAITEELEKKLIDGYKFSENEYHSITQGSI